MDGKIQILRSIDQGVRIIYTNSGARGNVCTYVRLRKTKVSGGKGTISSGFWDDDAEGNGGGEEAAVRVSRVRPMVAEGEEERDRSVERGDERGENRMSDSCATTPLPASSGDYANVIINCQCSLFNDSSSRLAKHAKSPVRHENRYYRCIVACRSC